MGANLAQNVKSALESQNVKLNYKQFVGNRVNKIREKEFINWYYVPNKENP